MSIIYFIILAVVVVVAAWFIATYNGLVKMRNQVREAWSDIDVQLKRRYDLIPNLVSTVKGYAKHEDKVFAQVTEARSKAMQAEKSGNAAESAQAENMLSGALKSLFAVAEAYPDLKANQNFLALQQELSVTEDKIQASRRFYNGNTRDYNTKQEQFPTNLVASMFGFKPAEFFEIGEGEKENPKVDFSESK
jgi:LemA protein